MLGVFSLPAFIRLGHECQDLLSRWDGMHVCTDQTSVYTLIQKSLGEMLTLRENPLYWRLSWGSNPRRCITQDSKPNTLPTELFWTPQFKNRLERLTGNENELLKKSLENIYAKRYLFTCLRFWLLISANIVCGLIIWVDLWTHQRS